jgi:hypothetical protein
VAHNALPVLFSPALRAGRSTRTQALWIPSGPHSIPEMVVVRPGIARVKRHAAMIYSKSRKDPEFGWRSQLWSKEKRSL